MNKPRQKARKGESFEVRLTLRLRHGADIPQIQATVIVLASMLRKLVGVHKVDVEIKGKD